MGRDEDDADPAAAAEALAQRIQEERRLMYVGITRARRSLHLSWCKKRRRAREDVVREKSRFIEEMGTDQPGVAEDPAAKALSPKERLGRSEEHTSELQSLMRISYAVFCLKKKRRTKSHTPKPQSQNINT